MNDQKSNAQTVDWNEPLGNVDSAMALISFEPRFFRAAADILRGQHVELLEDDFENIGDISTADVLHWLDSMAEHCNGDLHHLLRGPRFLLFHLANAYSVSSSVLSMIDQLQCM